MKVRCRHQTTVTAATIVDSPKLPLTTWFLAMYLFTHAKNNVSALELTRDIGVSWCTAWRVKHKLMQVMAERESRRQLAGRVEINDAYVKFCQGRRAPPPKPLLGRNIGSNGLSFVHHWEFYCYPPIAEALAEVDQKRQSFTEIVKQLPAGVPEQAQDSCKQWPYDLMYSQR